MQRLLAQAAFIGLIAGTQLISLADAKPPNIVFILADDLAWSDLGCYGNTVHETPNINRLAREGMRFTQAYAPAPICSASRAAILTGKTPARLNFEFVTKFEPGQQNLKTPLKSPPYSMNLLLEEITFGKVLKSTGYGGVLWEMACQPTLPGLFGMVAHSPGLGTPDSGGRWVGQAKRPNL